jgi:hypothetical protein
MNDDDDQMKMEYGSPVRERFRKNDLDTSREFAERTDSVGWEELIHTDIVGAGMEGMSLYDFVVRYGVKYKVTVSPMFAPLCRKSLIFYSGTKRDRCSIWLDEKLRSAWMMIAEPEAIQKMEEYEASRNRDGIEDMKRELLIYRSIAADSQGVAGYHLNGDIAYWESFDIPYAGEIRVKG